MQRRLLSLLFLVVLTGSAVAQLGVSQQNTPGVRIRSRNVAEYLATQKILLSNFCRMDFEGARLQASGWNRFKPYTSLRTNPEFQRVVVVVRFDIESTEQPSETVRVNYKAVGFYDMTDGYTVTNGSDRAQFRVQEQNENLVITEISPTSPHVSPRAAREWMNARMNDASTPELERAHLKDAIAEVSKLVPQAHPAVVAQ